MDWIEYKQCLVRYDSMQTWPMKIKTALELLRDSNAGNLLSKTRSVFHGMVVNGRRREIKIHCWHQFWITPPFLNRKFITAAACTGVGIQAMFFSTYELEGFEGKEHIFTHLQKNAREFVDTTIYGIDPKTIRKAHQAKQAANAMAASNGNSASGNKWWRRRVSHNRPTNSRNTAALLLDHFEPTCWM